MAIKVLYAVPRVHDAIEPVLARLRDAGCELIFNRIGRTLSEDELIGLPRTHASSVLAKREMGNLPETRWQKELLGQRSANASQSSFCGHAPPPMQAA